MPGTMNHWEIYKKTLYKPYNLKCHVKAAHGSKDTVALPFEEASTVCLKGATKSGKSTWLHRLLKNKDVMFSVMVKKKSLFCYIIYQPLFDEMKTDVSDITFHEGLPTEQEVKDFTDGNHNLVILDDLSDEAVKDPDFERLFTRGAHHLNTSVFFVSHNCFCQGNVPGLSL